jgi:peptidoglycan/xylan/chitin deacetylase (PgdA/CDA1 family)
MHGQGAEGADLGSEHPARDAKLAMIPILLYHSVFRGCSCNADRFALHYERFATHLDAIVESGRTPLTISEVGAGLRGERQLPDRPVAITFDDGYADTTDAIELIWMRGLRASVFVTTGQIGTVSMISSAQLGLLACRPDILELGAHSVTHPHLDELSRSEIESEVSISKQQLEHTVGRRVESFAYPYGAYDRRVRDAVVAAGYQTAVAVKNALSHQQDDPWAIARWTVRATTRAGQIAEVLEGEGAPPAWREERLRTRGYRKARRLRRSLSRRVGAWR